MNFLSSFNIVAGIENGREIEEILDKSETLKRWDIQKDTLEKDVKKIKY